ncbi:MAG: glutamate-5-semialdehyde dehydrogenase [Kiritimatiellae bacterium]|nr:glutamate-5-semialdehyde dehydrogenase [Kiritimatiellia bacterium]
METAAYIRDMATRARSAAAELAKMTTDEKNAALLAIADALEAHRGEIAAANAADVARAKENGISPSMLDRLTLTPARFDAMVAGVRHVASLPDPVGETIWTRERPSGIKIRKVRVPLGVIAVVFESRPNVFVDTAALCLKTGNAVILRGGKEAIESNKALAAAVHSAMKGDAIQLVEILDHAAVTELVRAVGLVDVAIPRGGERLIRAMCEAALVPVLKHYKGVCHIYVDDKADLAMALAILDNAKTQRPGVCNAAECLLVHEKLAPVFMPMVEAWAKDKGVTLHENEAGTEYLSLDINVAKVADFRAAIDFINANSSHHSDCIVTNDEARAAEFLRDVDSAAVYHNVSTRFTDGGEFGMGAEIGISTDKLHARGPMGLEELTTYKYTITGDGVVRK